MSLLQGQCPQGGGDVDWAQAVVGAGCRHGKPAQGAAVRCAGQPKRIGQVRTGRSALEQPCTLRGRLGRRRTVTVWGGADATPDRAIGQFANANWVSIPGCSGS